MVPREKLEFFNTPFSRRLHPTRFIQILTTALITGLLLFATPATAQDIDDVMDGLDQDFKFGGKEDIKRNNISNTNEALREDTSISNSQPGLVDVQFFVKEYFLDGAAISLEVVGESSVVSGVDGTTSTGATQLKPGTTHQLKVSCTGMFSCEFYIFIVKGALFTPSLMEDTGNTTLFLSPGGMTLLEFKVSADNSAPARPIPTPPPATPM